MQKGKSQMTKEVFIKRILCEHWFDCTHWKVKKWNENKKQIWLSGMHRAWNILFPLDTIEPLEIVTKATTWSKQKAEQWYADYVSEKQEDNGSIQSRFDIMDL